MAPRRLPAVDEQDFKEQQAKGQEYERQNGDRFLGLARRRRGTCIRVAQEDYGSYADAN